MSVTKESKADKIERLLGPDERSRYECSMSQVQRAKYRLNKWWDARLLLAEFPAERNGEEQDGV